MVISYILIMKNIIIIFGGKSVEHEVSIITGKQVIENIDKSQFNPIPVYIDREGVWWHGNDFSKKETFLNFDKTKHKKVFCFFGENSLYIKNLIRKKRIPIFAAVNCCHGTNGEDGALQGIFECLNIPYTSSEILGSSLCMNKIVMKQLFEFFNYRITRYKTVKRGEEIDLSTIVKEFTFPLFVKPANLGSSVGINKCENEEELKYALEVALNFDEWAIIEEAVLNLREINCSVQRIDGRIETSDLEEPISWEKFLTFEEKYINRGKKSGQKRKINVELPKELEEEIRKISKECYEKFFLDGIIRIDFLFNNETKQLYINEINTIPGSLSFYLWKGKGISFKKLISLAIMQAITRFENKKKNKTDFHSDILK